MLTTQLLGRSHLCFPLPPTLLKYLRVCLGEGQSRLGGDVATLTGRCSHVLKKLTVVLLHLEYRTHDLRIYSRNFETGSYAFFSLALFRS